MKRLWLMALVSVGCLTRAVETGSPVSNEEPPDASSDGSHEEADGGSFVDAGSSPELSTIDSEWRRIAFSPSPTNRIRPFDQRVTAPDSYSVAVWEWSETPGNMVIAESGADQGVSFSRKLWNRPTRYAPIPVYLPDGSIYLYKTVPKDSGLPWESSWLRKDGSVVSLGHCDTVFAAKGVRLPDGLMPVDGIIQLVLPQNCSDRKVSLCAGFAETAIVHLHPDGTVRHSCQRAQVGNAPVEWFQSADGRRIAGGDVLGERWHENLVDAPTGTLHETWAYSRAYAYPYLAIRPPDGSPQKYFFVGYDYDQKLWILGGYDFKIGTFASTTVWNSPPFDHMVRDAVQWGQRVVWVSHVNEQPTRVVSIDITDASARVHALRLREGHAEKMYLRLATDGRDLYLFAAELEEGGMSFWARRISDLSEL